MTQYLIDNLREITFHIIIHNNLFENKQQTMNVLTPILFEVCKAEKY